MATENLPARLIKILLGQPELFVNVEK